MKLLSRSDMPFLAALAVLLAVYMAAAFDFDRVPFEDAAMLMRYATHVAEGHGVVWNVGEEPVDGATDFLFMAVVAALAKTGMRPETAVRGLGLVAHLLTVLFVYANVRRFARGYRWIAFFTAAFFACGPGLRYVEAYFGTTFFAFLACLTWHFALDIIERGATRALALRFALIALATGLTRPEGVFLVLLMLVAVVCAKGWRASATTVAVFVVMFAFVGGAYMLWRKSYFGYFLPNPFYAKGGGEVHLPVLLQSIRNVATLLLPLVPVLGFAAIVSLVNLWKPATLARVARPVAITLLVLFVLGLLRTSNPGIPNLVFGRYSPAYTSALAVLLVGAILAASIGVVLARLRTRGIDIEYTVNTAHLRRWTLVIWIPVLGFTVIWLLIQDYMNYLLRFQYALLPMVCMVWPAPFVGAFRLPPMGIGQRALVVLGAILVAGSIVLQRAMMPVQGRFHDGRFDMAIMLGEFAARGYTMATTEAGLLPYYSRWDAIDVYGYNDRWIAHHGLTAEYLDQRNPELVVVAGTVPISGGRPAIAVLKRYVETGRYSLAAAFGDNPSLAHYYYVRRDFADSDVLQERIASFEYAWYLSGRTASDIAPR